MKKILNRKLGKSFISLMIVLTVFTTSIIPSSAVPSSPNQDIITFYSLVQDLDISTRDYIIAQIANTTTFNLNSPLDTDAAATSIATRINNPEMTQAYVKSILDKMVTFNELSDTNKFILRESFRLFYNPLIEATAPEGADVLLDKIYNYTFTYKMFVNGINYVKTSISNIGIFSGIPLYKPYGTTNIKIDPNLEEIINIYINSFPNNTPEAAALKAKIQSYYAVLQSLIDKFNDSSFEEKFIVINDLAYNYGGLVRLEVPLDLDTNLDASFMATGIVSKETLAEAFLNATLVNKRLTVRIRLLPSSNAKMYAIKLPSSYLSSGYKNRLLQIVTPFGTITLNGAMFKSGSVPLNSTIKITVEIKKAASLNSISSYTKSKIGNRPVISINAYINDIKVAWKNADSPVTISVPYTPTALELKNNTFIVVWYIDSRGKAYSVPNGGYNTKTGFVTFITTHFTDYAIAYLKKSFTDENMYTWQKKSIETLYTRGVINESKTGKFYPDNNITRGEFVSYLIRALGISATVTKNFSDVTKSYSFYNEVGIAKKLNIVEGRGKNMYYPKSTISRQDMMVIAVKAMKYAGKLTDDEITSKIDGKFVDKSKVSSYALLSVATLIKTGIIEGSGNKINPRANVTKAVAALTVFRILSK